MSFTLIWTPSTRLIEIFAFHYIKKSFIPKFSFKIYELNGLLFQMVKFWGPFLALHFLKGWPRSSDPFLCSKLIYIKWVTTSWTTSIMIYRCRRDQGRVAPTPWFPTVLPGKTTFTNHLYISASILEIQQSRGIPAALLRAGTPIWHHNLLLSPRFWYPTLDP